MSDTYTVLGGRQPERYRTRLGVAHGQLAHLEVPELERLQRAISRLIDAKDHAERVLAEVVGGEGG